MREFSFDDGFAVSAIMDKMGVELDLNAIMDAAQSKDKEKAAYLGGQLMLTLVKKMHLAKDDIIKLVAGITEEPVDVVSKYGFAKLMEVIKAIAPGVGAFFKSAGV